MALTREQQKAFFALQGKMLSGKDSRFTAVVFDDTLNERKISAGMNQSPREIAKRVEFKGKEIIGSVSAKDREEFVTKLKKIKGVVPESAEGIAKFFGSAK